MGYDRSNTSPLLKRSWRDLTNWWQRLLDAHHPTWQEAADKTGGTYVGFWHLPINPVVLAFGRSWSNSGHLLVVAISPGG